MPMALVVETKGEEISVLVIDAGAPNLRRFHKTEGLSTVKLPEGLQVPHGIALDEGGALLIAELEGHRVVRLRGDQMDVVFGNGRPSRAPALLNRAADVVVAGGYLWVADIGNHQVKGIPWPPAPAR